MRMTSAPIASLARRAARQAAAAGLLWLTCLALPAFAQPAPTTPTAPELSKDEVKALTQKCLECHDDAEMKTDDGKSMAVLAGDYARSAHRKLQCSDCHDAALTIKHPRNALGAVKPQVCQDCHEDEFKAIAGSIHGRRAAGERAIKDCNACHGSLHTVHKSGDPASPHFNDQAVRYSTGQLRDVYFYPEQLEGHVERRYRPGSR